MQIHSCVCTLAYDMCPIEFEDLKYSAAKLEVYNPISASERACKLETYISIIRSFYRLDFLFLR